MAADIPTMKSASRVVHRIVVMGAVALVLGALVASCGVAEDILSAKDERAYTDASRDFIAANGDFQDAQIAPGQGESGAAALAAMRAAVVEMQAAQRELEDVAGRLKGRPAEVAVEGTDAAAAVVTASEAIIAALEANDPVAWTDAYDANADAIDAFNDATQAWNDL